MREHEEALTAQGTQLAQAHAELERLRSAEDIHLADIATLRAALLRAFAAGSGGGGSGEMEEVEQECTRERLERGGERQRVRAAEKQVSLLEARLAKASNDLALAQVSTHLRPLFLQPQHLQPQQHTPWQPPQHTPWLQPQQHTPWLHPTREHLFSEARVWNGRAGRRR